jgi:hypothetical protein
MISPSCNPQSSSNLFQLSSNFQLHSKETPVIPCNCGAILLEIYMFVQIFVDDFHIQAKTIHIFINQYANPEP